MLFLLAGIGLADPRFAARVDDTPRRCLKAACPRSHVVEPDFAAKHVATDIGD